MPNQMMASSTATAKKSSTKPSQRARPKIGKAKSRLQMSAPNASTTVRPSTLKTQKVKKCDSPAPVHLSSLRWPSTSSPEF